MTDVAYLASIGDRSPTGRMFALLDEVTDSLMEEGNKVTKAALRERAQAIADCIAIVQCCFADEVKEAEMLRYEERHGIE